MNKYAIMADGVVINLAVSEGPLEDNWLEVENGVEIGDLWDGAIFTKPAPDYDAALKEFQEQRAAKLAETDWWAIRASEPGGIAMTEAQLAYRQALRSMDDAEGFDPFAIFWPVAPGA